MNTSGAHTDRSRDVSSLAVVGPTTDGSATAVWHVQLVQVGDSNVTVKAGDLTGAWVVPSGDPDVTSLTEGRLVFILGRPSSTDPADLLVAIQREISAIQEEFDAVQNARPRKRNGQPRSPLVSPFWPTLPSRAQVDRGEVSQLAVPDGDNAQVREVLMQALLFSHLLQAWSQVENERTARKFLRGDRPYSRPLPPGWPAGHR